MSNLTVIFDDAIRDIFSFSDLEDKWKIRFIAKCFEQVHEYGWREYSESRYWDRDLVQQAFHKFSNEYLTS